jgi:hypothetical protein
LCQGDCDTDKDCKGTLKCYQRRDPSVPALGCEGVVEDDSSKWQSCNVQLYHCESQIVSLTRTRSWSCRLP